MSRRLIPLAVLAGLLAPVAAAAQTAACPPAPDHAQQKADLLDRLRVAPDAEAARFLSDGLWRIWTDAPDARAQDLLDRGMKARESFDFLGARDILDALVEYCPDYAEGYNQRAFASFLRQDFAAALHDLDMALGIDPQHVAALSGKALSLMGLGREDEAQEVLRAAVRLNPWLGERALLRDAEGQDI